MRSIGKLEEAFLLEGGEVLVKGMPFIKALRLFDTVVTSCFGMALDPQFEDHISAFKEAYLGLGISVTPKI